VYNISLLFIIVINFTLLSLGNTPTSHIQVRKR